MVVALAVVVGVFDDVGDGDGEGVEVWCDVGELGFGGHVVESIR